MKYGLFIGRFQPVHKGHIHALSIAAAQVDTLIILVGSSNQCRSIKNPWTFEERSGMLQLKLHAEGILRHSGRFGHANIKILPLNDYRYNNDQWISEVRSTVNSVCKDNVPTLFGHNKDGNNYLSWFPEWKFQNIEAVYDLNATQIREQMFRDRDSCIRPTVHADWAYYQKEKELFKNYPFPETLNFNCSDAVVICQGKILLIKRKFAPGKDTWALPGGFRNGNETFLDCAIRELQEETNIRVPEKVLRGCIVKTQLFDSPTRSFGIPRNTLAVMIKIQPDADGKPPRANGSDDAAEIKWVDLNDALAEGKLYDDHADIISEMTGVKPTK